MDNEYMDYPNAKQLNSINILIDVCLINRVILMTMWNGKTEQTVVLMILLCYSICTWLVKKTIFSPIMLKVFLLKILKKRLILVYVRYANYVNKLYQ